MGFALGLEEIKVITKKLYRETSTKTTQLHRVLRFNADENGTEENQTSARGPQRTTKGVGTLNLTNFNVETLHPETEP